MPVNCSLKFLFLYFKTVSYENGKFVGSNSDNLSLKSVVVGIQSCNFNCVYTCFNGIMTSDWLYGTVCAAACVGWEQGKRI
jgi:hypothetical protein